jgi:hypothetical protein
MRLGSDESGEGAAETETAASARKMSLLNCIVRLIDCG